MLGFEICIYCFKMHHYEAIFQKISRWRLPPPPDPHLREGVTPSPTLPLSALRPSVKPSASDPGAPAVSIVLQRKKVAHPCELFTFPFFSHVSRKYHVPYRPKIHRYPCAFSEDIVTSWRQRLRAINTSVFNVHNLNTCPLQQQFSGFCDKQGVVGIRIRLLR